MSNVKKNSSLANNSSKVTAVSFREKLPIIQKFGKHVIDARGLHQLLQVSVRFNDWMNRRINEYDFIKDEEFYSNLSKTQKQGGRPKKEYYVTIDMAKELAMVERNEIGRQMRRYFIEIEKRYRTEVMQPALYGIFKGLTGVLYMGHRCYPYTGVLRNIGYSTKSGAVQERKKKFKGQFFKLFGRNFITAELAEHLKESFMIRLNQRNLQMQLPFEAEGGQNG
jgi:phage anti-repressor protein